MLGFFGRNFSAATRLSTWRQISLELWDEPRDPTVYGNLEINMTRAIEYLRQASEESGIKITVTHLVAKAIARALALERVVREVRVRYARAALGAAWPGKAPGARAGVGPRYFFFA